VACLSLFEPARLHSARGVLELSLTHDAASLQAAATAPRIVDAQQPAVDRVLHSLSTDARMSELFIQACSATGYPLG